MMEEEIGYGSGPAGPIPPPPPPPSLDLRRHSANESEPVDPFTDDDSRTEPGSLHIVGRRSWKTWQLSIAVVLAAVFGMWFNGNTGSATETTGSSSSSGGFKIPAAAGTSSSTTTTAAPDKSTTSTTASVGGSTATTTAPGSSSTSSTTVAQAVGPATVLIPATELAGNWTSSAFTIAGGTWNIGWAFSCAPVPAATPTFAVFVVKAGASAGTTPAVTSSAPSGQSVTPQTSTGSQQIIVHAPSGCRWVAKVTGSSS